MQLQFNTEVVNTGLKCTLIINYAKAGSFFTSQPRVSLHLESETNSYYSRPATKVPYRMENQKYDLYINSLRNEKNNCQQFMFVPTDKNIKAPLVVYIFSLVGKNELYCVVVSLDYFSYEEASDVWWTLEHLKQPILNTLEFGLWSRLDVKEPQENALWKKPYTGMDEILELKKLAGTAKGENNE